jgi:hypothetical protein
MKVALSIGCLALIVAGCQKNLSKKESSLVSASATVSSDALLPLPCHSTSFISDYPVQEGSVPPFRFTKTLYPDTRVKEINMVTRKYPIYAAYLNHSIELNGTFSYSTERAYLKGTEKTWEHYFYGNGVTKKLISTKNVNLKFYITPQGYCTKVTDLDRATGPAESQEVRVLSVNFNDCCDPSKVTSIVLEGGVRYWYPVYDQYGNVTTYQAPFSQSAPYLTYTYDYSKPCGTKNYSFIPSQNWFSQEYSLLEVMQWLPQSNHQRKTVAATFYPFATTNNPGQKIVQSQTYNNFQFDSKGNLTSVTYGDNVPQRTTWYCN